MSERPPIHADGTVDERARVFVDELKRAILARHPDATFEVALGIDNPEAIRLDVYVDLDEPSDVLDEIIDRVVEIQVEEGVPLHVIPLHTPERALERARAYAQQRQHRRRTLHA